MSDLFPNASFGPPDEEDEDENQPLEDDDDSDDADDDDELEATPPDVIAMLGFDPAEEEDE